MIEAIKNIWKMGKFLPLLVSDKDVTIVPERRVDIGNIGEIFMSDQTWHVIKEKGVNFERATITYSPGDDNYLITSRAGGSGSLRPLGIRTNVNNESIHIATDGKVGINNETPATKLDIAGQVEINPSSAVPPMIIGGNATGVQVDGLNVTEVGGNAGFGEAAGKNFYNDVAGGSTSVTTNVETNIMNYVNSGDPAISAGDIVRMDGYWDAPGQMEAGDHVVRIRVNNTIIYEGGVSAPYQYNNDRIGDVTYFAAREGNIDFYTEVYAFVQEPIMLIKKTTVNVPDLSAMTIRRTIETTSGGTSWKWGGINISKRA